MREEKAFNAYLKVGELRRCKYISQSAKLVSSSHMLISSKVYCNVFFDNNEDLYLLYKGPIHPIEVHKIPWFAA